MTEKRITPDKLVQWREVPAPKFKKEYPEQNLLVKKMPSPGQYVGGSYYSGSREEDIVPDGSVLMIYRRIKDGAHMPVILSCHWFCPCCGRRHEKIIPEKMIDDGGAVFVEPMGLKKYSWEQTQSKRPLTLYLAMPYTHPDASVRQDRYEHSRQCSKQLIQHGYGVIAPICMGHPIVETSTPDAPVSENFEAWKDVCLRMLESSDIMCVLLLDGVRESIGVAAEIDHARSLGKPIILLHESSGTYAVDMKNELWR